LGRKGRIRELRGWRWKDLEGRWRGRVLGWQCGGPALVPEPKKQQGYEGGEGGE
jgi:hypothetical protein